MVFLQNFYVFMIINCPLPQQIINLSFFFHKFTPKANQNENIRKIGKYEASQTSETANSNKSLKNI